MLNGFINIYKSGGISSNRALSILKRRLFENNINTKVGHLGTLDPIAEGVLPVALGRATRLFDCFLAKEKKYTAVFDFGVATDTLDNTGIVIGTGRRDVTLDEITSVLPDLIGDIMQIPPDYSAKNVNGERAYKLARKGKDFELPPKQVKIYDIQVKRQLDVGKFEFEITCGGGTYIRSIVRDMANALGTVGIMSALLRTKSGPFVLEKSVNPEKIGDIYQYIIPIEDILQDFGRIQLNDEQFKRLNNGLNAYGEGAGMSLAYTPDGQLMGICEAKNSLLSMKTWLL